MRVFQLIASGIVVLALFFDFGSSVNELSANPGYAGSTVASIVKAARNKGCPKLVAGLEVRFTRGSCKSVETIENTNLYPVTIKIYPRDNHGCANTEGRLPVFEQTIPAKQTVNAPPFGFSSFRSGRNEYFVLISSEGHSERIFR